MSLPTSTARKAFTKSRIGSALKKTVVIGGNDRGHQKDFSHIIVTNNNSIFFRNIVMEKVEGQDESKHPAHPK